MVAIYQCEIYASDLTRCSVLEFRIGGGLAWLAILTVGVVGEQIKTRLEEQAEKEGTKVWLVGLVSDMQNPHSFLCHISPDIIIG